MVTVIFPAKQVLYLFFNCLEAACYSCSAVTAISLVAQLCFKIDRDPPVDLTSLRLLKSEESFATQQNRKSSQVCIAHKPASDSAIENKRASR